MSRRIEKRTETIEHEIRVLVCDICDEEVSPMESPMYGSSFQKLSDYIDSIGPRRWWQKPIDRIVGLKRDSVSDEADDGDFDVHVGCAYDAIKRAVEGTNLSSSKYSNNSKKGERR